MGDSAKVRVGNVYPTKHSGSLEILEYKNYESVKVKFIETGSVLHTRARAISSGSVKDPLKPSVCDVGYIGMGRYKNVRVAHKNAYSLWERMLRRCYVESSHNYKYYGGRGVTVNKDWHNFQNFADWYYENHREGLELDKDVLSGDKPEYGPNTCIFITPNMNKFLKISVRYNKMCELMEVGNKCIAVNVRDTAGVNRYMGLYDSPTEALYVYSDVKHSYFVDLLEDDWRFGRIPETTYRKLSCVSPVFFFEKALIYWMSDD